MWLKVWFFDHSINYYPCEAIMAVERTEDSIKIYFKDNSWTSKPIKKITQIDRIVESL